MTYAIYHKTDFHYQNMVTFSHNIARLKPKHGDGQELLEFAMEIAPDADDLFEYADSFGNANHHILVREAHHTLSVTGRSTVRIDAGAARRRIETARRSTATFDAMTKRMQGFDGRDIGAKRFLFESELIAETSAALRDYALESFHPKRPLFEAGEELMARIFGDFEFVPGFSNVATPVEETFESRKGVCQDFAHLAIAALRSAGIPARYVSGYIETDAPEGQEKLFGADASHAWFSMFVPDTGWVDFDPTNNVMPTDRHVVLGYGRDYYDIAPLKGVVRSSGDSRLSVMVDVRRLD